MARPKGIKQALSNFTSDKPEWDRKAVAIKKSFDEVSQVLNGTAKKKK